MHILYQAIATLVALVLVAVLKSAFDILQRILRPLFSPLRLLPGPPSSSWLFGNLLEIRALDNVDPHEQWFKQYGPVFKYKGFLNVRYTSSIIFLCPSACRCPCEMLSRLYAQNDRVLAMDMRATAHVLSHTQHYEKPGLLRYSLGNVLGNGASPSHLNPISMAGIKPPLLNMSFTMYHTDDSF